MASEGRRRIPLKEGLFTVSSTTDEIPQLIGSKCPSCGEINFPKRQLCPNCHERNVEEIKLSRKGKIYSFTVVMQRPPIYYKGPIPYAMGFVELPEGVRVQSLFTGCDPETLKIDMDVELVIEKLYVDDEGNEIVTYKFRPICA